MLFLLLRVFPWHNAVCVATAEMQHWGTPKSTARCPGYATPLAALTGLPSWLVPCKFIKVKVPTHIYELARTRKQKPAGINQNDLIFFINIKGVNLSLY